jgi:hypothetical protein
MKTYLFFCFAALALVPAQFAFGWGYEGHEIVARIADDNLTTHARENVKALLGNQTMEDVASWADSERSRHRNQGGWHYIDIEISDGSILPESSRYGTCLDAVTSFTDELASRTADLHEQKIALMYVIHIIGDMHQPLHCADNYDKGGNGVKVQIFGKDQNLHRAWDSSILEHAMADDLGTSSPQVEEFAQWIERKFAAEKPAAMQGRAADWVKQSNAAAKNVAYSYLKSEPFTSMTVTLGPEYYAKAKPTVEHQLALGGFRLAKVLNDSLDKPLSGTLEQIDKAQ